MVSEAVHSFTDTMNQLVLYYGISAAKRPPSVEHPYGHQNMKYVTSLVSGVGIFCLGAGVSIWHGVSCLYAPHVFDQHEIFWARIHEPLRPVAYGPIKMRTTLIRDKRLIQF